MADISLVVDVKQNGVTSAIKNTKALESNVKLLSNSYKSGNITQRQYYRGLLELAKASGKSEAELRKYANELRRAERASAAAAAQAKLEAQARKAAAQAAREAAAAQRAAAQAAEEAARETKRLADRQLELRMRFQEGYAQFARQREAMRSLREAYRSGIITLAQYEAQLARIRAVNQGNVAGTNNLGVAMQQTGYQVGDFMVQIQSGTNPMVAFGQQATQLVGVLYLLPPATLAARVAIMGLSVSVSALVMSLGIFIPIATAVGAYFMRMSGSSKNLSQRIDDLEATTQKVIGAFETLADTELNQKFGNTTESIRSMTSAMLGLNQAAQLQNLMAFLDKAESTASGNAFLKFLSEMVNTPTFGLVGLNAEEFDEKAFAKLGYDMSLATFNGFMENLKALAEAGDREGVVQTLTDFLKDASDNGAEVTATGRDLAEEMVKAALATAEVAAEMNGSAKAARVAALLEEKRVESIGLYYENLKKVSDLQQERADGVKAILDAVEAEKRSMTDTLALNQITLKFGKDSVQVRQKEAEIAREQYRLELMAAGIKGNHLIDAMALYDENAKVTEELTTSEEKAKGLADALKEAASAMASLANFGAGLDKALAVSIAKVDALKRGTDAAIAGRIAGMRVDLEAERRAALAANADPIKVAAEFGIGQATIDQIESSEAEGKLLEEGRRKSGRGGSKSDPLGQLIEEQQQRKILLGLTGEQRTLQEAIFQVVNKLGDAAKTTSAQQIEALAKENLILEQQEKLYEEKVSKIQNLANTIGSSMETAFMSMIDGTKSVKDAFRDMAAEIIKELYRVFVVQQLVGSFDMKSRTGSGIVGAIGKIFMPTPNANGNAFNYGRVTPFANGGVVGSPTYFPMAGGKTGLMGEAGPEAIMPLKRDKNGRLGVSVEGGSGSVVVNNNINVTGGSDPAAIRMEVAKLMPQIANATKTAVIDARRRGGQMKAAFG